MRRSGIATVSCRDTSSRVYDALFEFKPRARCIRDDPPAKRAIRWLSAVNPYRPGACPANMRTHVRPSASRCRNRGWDVRLRRLQWSAHRCRLKSDRMALLSTLPLRLEGLHHRPSDIRHRDPFARPFRTSRATRFPRAAGAEIGTARDRPATFDCCLKSGPLPLGPDAIRWPPDRP
jgi:hypothetical protein